MKRGGWLIGLDGVALVLLVLTLAWPVRLGLGFQLITAAVLIVVIVAHVALSGAKPEEEDAAADPQEVAPPASPVRRRADWIVLGLAVIALAAALVSGFLLPNAVTAGRTSNPRAWLGIHEFATAAALVLVGAHMGLNAPKVTAILGRYIRAPRAIWVVVLALVVAGGAVSVGTSGFLRWWSAPFTTTAGPGNVSIGNGTFPSGFPTGGNFPSGFPTAGTRPTAMPTAMPTDMPTGAANGTPGVGYTRGSGTRPTGGYGNGGGVYTQQRPGGPVTQTVGRLPGMAATPGAVALSAVEYAAIALMVAVVVGALGWALGLRRKPVAAAGPAADGPEAPMAYDPGVAGVPWRAAPPDVAADPQAPVPPRPVAPPAPGGVAPVWPGTATGGTPGAAAN